MRNVPAECGWAAWSYPADHQDFRTQGSPAKPSPAQPSPAQPRQPCVHLQCAAGQAAVSLFMETRVDGGDIISIRYVQRLCSAVGRVQATSCQ